MNKMNLPLAKNQEIEMQIDAFGSEGQGVGRYHGLAVFVPFALPGETVRALVVKVDKRFAVGKLLEVIHHSPERAVPRCAVFGKCGGCTMQHLSYQAQLRAKEQHVIDALTRIGDIPNAADITRPMIGMEDPWHYRNKGAFVASLGEEGPVLGLYAPRSHRVIPITHCPIQDKTGIAVLNTVREWARTFDVPTYDEQTGKGVLRHVLSRSTTLGQSMAIIVAAKPIPGQEALKALIERLRQSVPGLQSIVFNTNTKKDNVILGDRFHTVWGKERIEENIEGLSFYVSAQSFLQVNAAQTTRLYRAALDMAGLTEQQTVIDAYCGIGTISLFLALRAKKVFGIEIVAQAVHDAQANAQRNGIHNAHFICGPAEEELPKLLRQQPAPALLLLDPPRKGCDQALLKAAGASRIARIIYVSCNPATLARDCKILAQYGYRVQNVQPVDMFPQTGHVETLCQLICMDNN